jgi:hypothetical protein
MEFQPDDYILAVWFAETDGGDFLMSVKKAKGSDVWDGEYRYRYIKDDKIFDSEDEKSFYTMAIPDKTEEEVESILDGMFDLMKLKYSGYNEKLTIKGDINKFNKAMIKSKFCQIKIEKKND